MPAKLPAVLDHDRARPGGRVFIDPERGTVTLMAPSGRHETVAGLFTPLQLDVSQTLSVPFVPAGLLPGRG
ncbi:MAG: hypothetical protein OXE86_02760 [Alphaproteobacteria bacterium]|nr:hypothetical protein [Alphaproteobacteria bacterium]